MKKSTLIRMFWAFYLGATVGGLAGFNILDIRWWIITFPTIILAEWDRREYNKENQND